MPAAVVSGRVDDAIRQKADVVMRKAGFTPTEIIQNVWATMARTGSVPEAARPAQEGEDAHVEAFARLEGFLGSLPPVNPAYADLSDDEILALRVQDYA